MPLLFCLAIHNPLVAAKAEMLVGEQLFAFLDDVNTLTTPGRTRGVYDLLGKKLALASIIRLHTGKTRCWNWNNTCPPNMPELGREVWSPQGVKVLGTPVGTPEFVEDVTQRRLEEENRLWEAIPVSA